MPVVLPAPRQTVTDNVALLDSNYNQLFSDARPIKAVIKEESKVMEHPLETGAVVTDHTVIQPVEIELSMIVQKENVQDTYQQLKTYYLNRTFLIVQTFTDAYTNQFIQALPHEEAADQFGAITIGLKLKQALVVTSSTSTTITPKKPANSSTVDRGTQQPVQPKVSALDQLKNGIVSVFK